MSTWQERAIRIKELIGSVDEADVRTRGIMDHVLDESNADAFISRDFFNVQQTAGGLPEGMTFEQFRSLVEGHVRESLQSDSFADRRQDDDIRTAALSFDQEIRRHISFLNGVVHQAAAGEVHRKLWDFILDQRSDDQSIYAVYRDFLVDA